MSSSQAASELGLSVVPSELVGLPLQALFRYEPADRASSVYAIWSSRDERGSAAGDAQVQLVVTSQAPPDDDLGFDDLGDSVLFRLREGGSQVLVSAPDTDTLRAVLHELRPGVDLADADLQSVQ